MPKSVPAKDFQKNDTRFLFLEVLTNSRVFLFFQFWHRTASFLRFPEMFFDTFFFHFCIKNVVAPLQLHHFVFFGFFPDRPLYPDYVDTFKKWMGWKVKELRMFKVLKLTLNLTF